MAIEARELIPQIQPEFPTSGVIIEFPRRLTRKEKREIHRENIAYVQYLSLEQDLETVEKAERDMKMNPNIRLEDFYNRPVKGNGHLSISIEPEKDPFGRPIFRHPQTRHIP